MIAIVDHQLIVLSGIFFLGPLWGNLAASNSLVCDEISGSSSYIDKTSRTVQCISKSKIARPLPEVCYICLELQATSSNFSHPASTSRALLTGASSEIV